ncbi:MAG: AAA family ATPase [Saprospiraceae bacterium]|jgi:MoxR-like ATPase|nr:AAA family ATPase [Saprospiraceae bacterium]
MIKYIASPAQQYALEAALEMNQPLLITGEPGTGKTEMADWALDYLNKKTGNAYWPEVLRFNTKTISKATDLFYTYDALSHFQAANLRGGQTASVEQFIALNAFGKAVAYSDPARTEFAEKFKLALPPKPMNSVVLIDEVDKAPRDFTNDLLDEILNYRFAIREIPDFMAQKAPDSRIVVILTSNSEKNLPDAFLRRCAFFHIEFPKGKLLRDIVELHLGAITPETKQGYDRLLAFFERAREKSVRKAPATAELVAWLRILGLKGYLTNTNTDERRRLLEQNLMFLVKTRDDLEAVSELLKNAEV